jgi:hypothetical protein
MLSKDYDVYPFPNVGNNVFYQEFQIGNMLPNMGSTLGFGTKLAKTPITEVIDKTDQQIEKDEERKEDDMIYSGSLTDKLFESFFGESSAGGDERIPDKIEPIVHAIESKGYKVKYASPGYTNTRFDNDRNKDGVINAKMVTTGRIIFSRNYKFPKTPKGWEWKVLENGSKALYVKPFTYNEKMGSKKEAFQKWQKFYIDSITEWSAELPECGTVDETPHEEDNNFK